jgi:hypothetical protein
MQMAWRLQQTTPDGRSSFRQGSSRTEIEDTTSPRIVVCGDGVLHAITALACRICDLVAVYVPHEASTAETLAQVLVVHRASEACAIVCSSHTWGQLKPHVACRCVLLELIALHIMWWIGATSALFVPLAQGCS